MSLLAKIRQQQVPLARGVLGLFVVVWLNMALQPCAMAFGGSSNHGRTHCPPVQTEESPSTSEYEIDRSDPSVPLCETSAAQCAFVDDFNYDGRMTVLKVKDSPGDDPLAIAVPIPVDAPIGSFIASPGGGDSTFLVGDPPTLNVLYCVYLI